VGTIRIPTRLAGAVDEADPQGRRAWLATLPDVVCEIAAEWDLALGEAFVPGGQCSWVAPARTHANDGLVLKVGWRHPEAEHEADALRHWDGDGTVRCFASRSFGDTTALLLERCVPGRSLGSSLSEPEQDVIIAGLLRRLWARTPPASSPFLPLAEICSQWADSFKRDYATDGRGLDPGLAREGVAALRHLPMSADRDVLLCTDLHAGNVLSARREPWLVIDPKPFIGDPAFDPVQHILNCAERLTSDPGGLADRMADLLDLGRERLRLWLFARCAQESLRSRAMRELARRLAP
jgi:streptomycin 6-kinase